MFGIKCEAVAEPGADHLRALDAGELRVSGKGRLNDGYLVLAGVAEGADQQVNRVVAPAGDPQAGAVDAIKLGQPLLQHLRLWLGIAIDTRLALHQRGKRIFIGVEADCSRHRRAGNIDRRQRQDSGAREALGSRHARASAARAWASRPSNRASAAAGAASRRAPSRVTD